MRPINEPKYQVNVKDDINKGIALTFAFALFVPFVETSAKLLGENIAPPQITFVRFFVHVIIFGIYIYFTMPRSDWRAKPSWPLIVRGIFSTSGTICVYAGLSVMPLVDAVAIFFLQPLILTALSAVLLKEKVGMLRWSAVFLGMIGAMLVIGPNFDTIGWGATFPAMAALFHSLSALIARKWAGVATLPIFQFYTAASAVILMGMLFIIAAVVGYDYVTPKIPNNFEWFLLAVVAFGSIITNLVLTQAFRIAPSSVIAPFLYLHIVGSAIMGYFIFHQLPSNQTILGGLLVISAGLFVWWREINKNLK